MSKGRKPRPPWMGLIDEYLFKYVDDPQTINAQLLRIKEIKLTGTKTTASYELREGSTGGESTTKEDRYLIDIDRAEEQIRVSRARIALIDKIFRHSFNNEERTFIRLFWFTVPRVLRESTWARNKLVTDKVGWLLDQDKRDRPSSTYYDWRTRIYDKWWTILFGDMEKGE